MKKYNFIRTSDEVTAEKLRNEGFVELPKQGNNFMFINKVRENFEFSDSKIDYTNTLFV